MYTTSRFLLQIARFVFFVLIGNMHAYSQTGCSSDGGLRTCNLEGSHNLSYEADPKDIPFTLRSLWRGLALPYYVKVSPLSGSNFSLSADNGEQLDISLTFTPNSGVAQELNPRVAAGSFNGTTNDADTFLSIEIDTSQVPSSSRYSASFQMDLSQYFFIFLIDTETVELDIVLEVEPSIAIRNLGDINLSNSGINFGQAIEGTEDFCIGGIGFSNYTVNLNSSNGNTGRDTGNTYELGGATENIPYSVTYSDNLAGTSGIPPGGLGDIPGRFSRRADESCISDNARIYITVSPLDWENASESFYTDILTITVSSQ